jgi:hypothetical protein
MEAIDLIREHFTSLGTKRIEVPEWKLVIFATPMTLAEKNRIYKKSRDSDMELLVDILIMKATDEQGTKLFTVENKITLLNKADSNVLARVSNEIMSDRAPVIDDLKN